MTPAKQTKAKLDARAREMVSRAVRSYLRHHLRRDGDVMTFFYPDWVRAPAYVATTEQLAHDAAIRRALRRAAKLVRGMKT